jgi:hypothetical protein
MPPDSTNSARSGREWKGAAALIDKRTARRYSPSERIHGGVAQMVEHAAHIRSVKGSSPLAAKIGVPLFQG